MFIDKKDEVSHLKIFGCHVPKEKRSKLDHSRKKGIFVGYSDQSKAYKIYIPSFRKIEVSRDVTFDEDATFIKSIFTHVYEEDPLPEYQDMVEPQEPIESPQETISTRKRPV